MSLCNFSIDLTIPPLPAVPFPPIPGALIELIASLLSRRLGFDLGFLALGFDLSMLKPLSFTIPPLPAVELPFTIPTIPALTFSIPAFDLNVKPIGFSIPPLPAIALPFTIPSIPSLTLPTPFCPLD